ncbi:hypothetical protein C2857_005509 [Epichloe festucae Fl1]|uniref:Uncharacterized protein n=1 Tax=Epichloe festucae (strain Fl1) TaxID=877507 RepID=A0A7S9KST2_EPIFF|nr:hypothetical protein C2857_005509 [Epichloe festucae Fl1]
MPPAAGENAPKEDSSDAADLAQWESRGEQAASQLEANLTTLESRLEAMLAALEGKDEASESAQGEDTKKSCSERGVK